MTNKAQNTTNISPKLYEMTPYQVYFQQVRGTVDAIRASNQGLSYIAPQLGGLTGQLQVLESNIILQLVDFSVRDSQ